MGSFPKSGSGVSFLEAFHQRQRSQVSSELKRRDEALHTLKQWGRGLSRQRVGGAASAAGPLSRRQVVGEMAALFSSMSLSKRQRAAASCRQTITHLEQQRQQVVQLLQQLTACSPKPKVRGSLVKARSLQLQLQQQEHRCGAQRCRLPPHLLLPLPALSSSSSISKAQQTPESSDPWRRLLKRVRPTRRRASLPCGVGRPKGRRTGLPAVAVAAAAAAARTAGGAGVSGEDAGTAVATHEAAAAESAAQEAEAAAAATDFCDRVEQFASRHRSASAGHREQRQTHAHAGVSQASVKEAADELLQQATLLCRSAAADAAEGSSRLAVIGALNAFSRALQLQAAKCRQRLEIAARMQRLPGKPEGLRALSEGQQQRLCWPSPVGGSRSFSKGDIAASHEAAAAGDLQAAQQQQGDLAAAAVGGAAPETKASADLCCSLEEAFAGSKETLGDLLSADFVEDDSSLLDAETDCEYLLGRPLLPYERLLLKYRMLRRNGSADLATTTTREAAEAHFVEQLLQVVDDESTLPGDIATPEDECEPWAFWGGKGDSEAAKIEHLLGMVGELQQADMLQHSHLQPSLLPPEETLSAEERMLRSFFEGKDPGMPATKPELLPENPSSSTVEAVGAATSKEGSKPGSQSLKFPSAARVYKAQYLLGPWRGSLGAYSLEKPQGQ